MKNTEQLELEVSSLFPIDLTEALFAAHIFGISSIKVYLNVGVASSESAVSNSLVARGSYPLFDLVAKAPLEWQQIHTTSRPDGDHIDEFLEFLRRLKRIDGLSEDVYHRINTLQQVAEEAPKNDTGHTSWQALATVLLEKILSDLGFKSIEILPNSEFHDDGKMSDEQLHRFQQFLMSLPETQASKLRDGGRLEIFDPIHDVWIQSRTLLRSGQIVTFLCDDGGSLNFEISKVNEQRVRFRGLIECVLLGFRQANLIDLPWYCSGAEFGDGARDGTELVSPYSIRFPERINWRLNPPAYSLIDYENADVMAFCDTILGLDTSDDVFKHDFERLSLLPPVAKARLAKNQNAIRTWVASYEQVTRNHIVEWNLPLGIEKITRRVEKITFGYRQMVTASLLELSKRSTHKASRAIEAAEIKFRDLTGYRPSELREAMANSENEIERLSCLLNISIERGPLEALVRKSHRLQNSVSHKTRDEKDLNRAFSALRGIHMELATIYYAWFASGISGALKAHLLSIYTLMGYHGISHAFERILEKRRARGSVLWSSFEIKYLEDT